MYSPHSGRCRHRDISLLQLIPTVLVRLKLYFAEYLETRESPSVGETLQHRGDLGQQRSDRTHHQRRIPASAEEEQQTVAARVFPSGVWRSLLRGISHRPKELCAEPGSLLSRLLLNTSQRQVCPHDDCCLYFTKTITFSLERLTKVLARMRLKYQAFCGRWDSPHFYVWGLLVNI